MSLRGIMGNSFLVEGRDHRLGTGAKGFGGILLEEVAYDPQGRLLSGSLADPIVPMAGEVPEMVLIHQHSPSPLNPLGVKGVGEGGAVAPPAAIAERLLCRDALSPFGIAATAPDQAAAHRRSRPRGAPVGGDLGLNDGDVIQRKGGRARRSVGSGRTRGGADLTAAGLAFCGTREPAPLPQNRFCGSDTNRSTLKQLFVHTATPRPPGLPRRAEPSVVSKRRSNRSQKPPPSMPPSGIVGVPFCGFSATIASVVTSRPAIEAAPCSAKRTTLVGSMMPAFTMST